MLTYKCSQGILLEQSVPNCHVQLRMCGKSSDGADGGKPHLFEYIPPTAKDDLCIDRYCSVSAFHLLHLVDGCLEA